MTSTLSMASNIPTRPSSLTSPPNESASPITSAPRSSATSPVPPPRRKFDSEALKPHLKRIIQFKLHQANWYRDKERTKAWCAEIGDEVKRKMIDIEPKGFKYAVCTQIVENKEQAGRADLSCHWDGDSDTVAQEVWVNDTMICTLIALAVRIAY